MSQNTPHINLLSDIGFGKTVLMPGDPKRAEFIALNFLDDAVKVNDVRGVNGYTGYYKGEKVSVMRFGDGMTTNLILEKGIRHASCHATPYGTFSMGVVALEIESDMDETGGTLHFMYATDIENNPLGEITFDFTLKPKKST